MSIVLQTNSISKSFSSPGGYIDVLKDIDMRIESGESVSITGESGSGKTTLLNLLAGLEHQDHGEIFWHEESISDRSNTWLSQRRAGFLGFVFQSYHLFPELNTLENVIFPARLTPCRLNDAKKRAVELLDRVGLKDRMRHLPLKLSGGERQRVALARALLNKPKLILGDEPTGNLDERTAESVITTLLDMCTEENASLLLVTHNMSHAVRTDRQLHLHDGVLND